MRNMRKRAIWLIVLLTVLCLGQTTINRPPLTVSDSATTPPLKITARSAAPSTPSAQQIYLDDGTNVSSTKSLLRRWTGSAWQNIGQPYDVDLDTWAGISPHASWQDILDGTSTTLANNGTIREQLNAAPVYDNRDYANLAAAITAIGNTVGELHIWDAETLTASATFPATLGVVIHKGGSIVKAAAYTLTISGPFEAGLYQVFSGFTTVTLSQVKQVYPQWFGAVGNGTTDDTAAFTAALAAELVHPTAGNVGGGTIFLPVGDYKIVGPLAFTARMTDLRGQVGTRITADATTVNNVIEVTSSPGTDNYRSLGPFTIEGAAATDANGIYSTTVFLRTNGVQILDVGGWGLDVFGGGSYGTHYGLIVDNCSAGGIRLMVNGSAVQPNLQVFFNPRVSNNDNYGWFLDTVTNVQVDSGSTEGNEQKALQINHGSGIGFHNHYFEGNCATSGAVAIDVNESESIVFDTCTIAESSKQIRLGKAVGTVFRDCLLSGNVVIDSNCSGTVFKGNHIASENAFIDKAFNSRYVGNRVRNSYETNRGLAYPIQPEQVVWNSVGHNLVADSSCVSGAILGGTGVAVTQDTTTGWMDSCSTKCAFLTGQGPSYSTSSVWTGSFTVPTGSALAVSVSLKSSVADSFILFSFGTAPYCTSTVWVGTTWHRYVFLCERNDAVASDVPTLYFMPAEALAGNRNLYVDDLNVEVLTYAEAEKRLDHPVYVVTGPVDEPKTRGVRPLGDLQTKTIVMTVDLDDDASTDDYQFDDDAANVTEQVITLTNILPAYAELTGWQIRCFEGTTGATTATVQFGTTSGGTELANEATACDDTDEVIGTAAGAGTILAATNAARSLYFSVTPSANWNAMSSTGRWAILVVYQDFGAAFRQKNP